MNWSGIFCVVWGTGFVLTFAQTIIYKLRNKKIFQQTIGTGYLVGILFVWPYAFYIMHSRLIEACDYFYKKVEE